MKIGFIGQGWIGKNYANHFKERGFSVERYAKEEPYNVNREKIKECDIVFIAVPTPFTPEGFNDRIVREVVSLVGAGKIAVIKSTILPGTTVKIQKENPGIFVLHSPEFLREVSARSDIDNPDRHIFGIPNKEAAWREAAEKVLAIMPRAPYEKICTAEEAELTKYGNNVYLYTKLIYANILYDIAEKHGCDWNTIVGNITADERIGKSHFQPVHQVEHMGGKKDVRGAGGHCFIKDFATFHKHYEEVVGNEFGMRVLDAIRDKNIHLLSRTGKDADILREVYGYLEEI